MSNPKRNDPCPCGSGKKYKKCHGASNVIEFNSDMYNDELELLHQELLAFTFEKFEHEIEELIMNSYEPFLSTDEEMYNNYFTGLTSWAVFHVPIKNNQTIFDLFYQRKQSKIKHTRTKIAFSQWKDAKPSIYEIISSENNDDTLLISDLITEDVYTIPEPDNVILSEGEILIGILIPYIEKHTFFFTFIGLHPEKIDAVLESFYLYADKNDNLAEAFPDFLGDVLTTDNGDIEWENPIHEMVAKLFAKHTLDKGIDKDFIGKGVMLWYIYCQMENPSIKKLGSYAAALEYLVHMELHTDFHITQSQLAKEYETTAGSISTNYRKISEVLVEEIREIADDALFDEDFMDDENEDLTFPPQNGPFNMEREMRDLQKLLSAQNFESIDEANEFLQNMLQHGGTDSGQASMPPSSPRDVAQNILYDAQQVKGKKRKALIDEALKIYPNSPDAYLLLAETAETIKEHSKLLHQAVKAGEKDLGEEFFKENKGHFWLMIETRPYMRAKASYATSLEQSGFTQEAIKHYEELLALNPNDNQGIRYLLLRIYMELEQYDDANQLINNYKEEGSANWLFNKALLSYLRNGLTSKTKLLLKTADEQNPFVKDYLLSMEQIPTKALDYIGFRDESEAIAYVQENVHLWNNKDELLQVLGKLK